MFTSENDTPSIFLNTSGRQPLKRGLALSFRMSLKAIPLHSEDGGLPGWLEQLLFLLFRCHQLSR